MARVDATTNDRILAGAPPASANELHAALEKHGDGRAIKWALAHRRAFGAETAARVEEAATSFAASPYHAALVELVGAMHVYWPHGLLVPRVRAAIHLAIELDVLSSQELFLLLQPLLAVEERFDAYVRHAEARPLGARLRVAAIGRASAIAASYVGLGALLPGDRGEELTRVLEQLYRDRDKVVGVRAAWALGALAPHSDRARQIVERTHEPGLGARRAMAAKTAQWILGDLDEGAYLKELRKGSGKRDVFVRATAIHAMQLGIRVAPATTAAVVESLVEGAATEVLAAAAAFAAAIDDGGERDEMLARVRAEAKKRAPDAAVCFWAGPRSTAVDALHDAALALRGTVRESPRSSHDASAVAIERARRAVDTLEANAADGDDVDHALDVLLFDAPLLRDAAAASAESDAERVKRYVAWADTVERLRDVRIARSTATSDAASRRERLRRLARVLDAQPRADAKGARAPSASLHAACRVAVASLLAPSQNDPSTERPLALALTAAIEPLVESEAILATEVVAAIISLESVAIAKHVAAVARSPLADALRAAVALHDAIDAKAPTIVASASAFADALVALGASEPLAEAGRALADAASTSQRAASVAAWRDALARLDAALRAANARLGLAARAPIAFDKLERALQSRLAHAGLVPPLAAAPFGVERAEREIDKALPPIFAGLVDAVIHAAKAATRTSSAPTRRASHALRPGWRIGDYVVEKILGSGGMGHCVLVRRRLEESQKNARRWVLKLPQSEEFTSAFRNEALALLFLSKANHPAIVRFVSYVDYGYRMPFILMEHVVGEALDRRLLRGAIPLGELVAIGEKLAEGIATSHEMQVAHHDIKPANIILASDANRPVLVDWGLAGAAYPWAGTPEYMAPERYEFARGRKTANGGAANPPAADVFALGCVLAEMYSGRALISDPLAPEELANDPILEAKYRALDPSHRRDFACETIATRTRLLARRLARAMAPANDKPARALRALIERMLERRREDRPTAAEAAVELRALAKTT